MKHKYQLVATGGTFDRLHIGHKALLEKAFAVGEKVIIGVTSDEMVNRDTSKILREKVLTYNKRIEELENFLKSRKYYGREIITKLNNTYGPTVLDKNVQAVVCTRETRSGAVEINKARKEEGLAKVEIVECSFITSADRFHISSTRIRMGEIDRQGDILARHPFGKSLPADLRSVLARPLDKLYPDAQSALGQNGQKTMLVVVGDQVNMALYSLGIVPDITVIDLMIRRRKIKSLEHEFEYIVKNPAGTITKKLISVLGKSVKLFIRHNQQIKIRVIWEEDLAVLPAILVAPLGTVILYGQPPINGIQKGVVRVMVTEEKKRWVVGILEKFK